MVGVEVDLESADAMVERAVDEVAHGILEVRSRVRRMSAVSTSQKVPNVARI
jgi:hypothetical protein